MGRHRIQRLSPEWRTRLQIREGDLIELVPPTGAPVRAWARFDAELAVEEIGLDEHGRELLGIEIGDLIQLRIPTTLNSANDLDVRQGVVQRVDH
jgi:hypothetical protein